MTILQNLKILLTNKYYLGAYILLVGIAYFVWDHFTEHASMWGNYGTLHTSIDIAISIGILIGFPLFILAWIYRSYTLGGTANSGRENIGWLGGIIGFIISGSSCCGLTLASYFGLLPIMAFLPFSGLELKSLALIGLLYALYSVLKNLTTCPMRRPKKSKIS